MRGGGGGGVGVISTVAVYSSAVLSSLRAFLAACAICLLRTSAREREVHSSGLSAVAQRVKTLR